MRVGLNATCLNNRPSGAKQRFVGIYGELIRRMPDDEFMVFGPADCRVDSWFADAPNVSIRRTPLHSERRLERFVAGLAYWQSALRTERLDVFEGFNLPLVTARSARNVMTIHDVRGLRVGRNPLGHLLYGRALDSACARADQIITVSESVKQEVSDRCPNANVAVIHNGLDIASFSSLPPDIVRRNLRAMAIPEDFLLAVGHFEPRKNYVALIDALAISRSRGNLIPLVIVGNDSGSRILVERRVRQHQLEDSVTLLSGLTDTQVHCAYQGCNAFVFPSTYEGFGIPILEAMASGRPMVLSDLPVFREITQDQGVYFPPDSPEAMADAIGEVCGSSEIRRKLVDYGHQRVNDFAFEVLAQRLQDLYLQGVAPSPH